MQPPKLLGSHHSTLTARSESALDHAITEWQGRFERELEEHRRNPEGLPVLVRGCGGSHPAIQRPSWLPAPLPPPQALSFRFLVKKTADGALPTAHVCAELLDVRGTPVRAAQPTTVTPGGVTRE